jgi:ubiquinone/menaquinone biosynthesis C-methylase UbiE
MVGIIAESSNEGRAEALPFPDSSIDVALACAILEEGDADRMLAELIRITKPGGRIGVVVRAG